jgi:hypothetical protein
MNANATNTEKKKIDWLFPENNQGITVTVEDFREMVHEAESQPTMSFREHKKLVDEWLRNHR